MSRKIPVAQVKPSPPSQAKCNNRGSKAEDALKGQGHAVANNGGKRAVESQPKRTAQALQESGSNTTSAEANVNE